MTVELAGFVIDAADPVAVASFWCSALGGELQMTDAGARVTGDTSADLLFRPQTEPKTVKNRVHFDVHVDAVEPLLELGARVLAEYLPERATLADPEGNEFCAFLDPTSRPRAQVFAVCIDSARPEELARWWAGELGARVEPGPDGTPRWLYGAAGSAELIWKFVRVDDRRVGPNRWQWRVRGGPMNEVAGGPGGVCRDPQGNEFVFV